LSFATFIFNGDIINYLMYTNPMQAYSKSNSASWCLEQCRNYLASLNPIGASDYGLNWKNLD
jgi:hypothetical protein